MGKVSIGLRGWRFDEDEVFDDEGRIRPLGAMDEDARLRVLRLAERVTDPCDACWLIHRDEGIEQCNEGTVIYGEPRGEVVLCDDHERDFVYWFRREADEALYGDPELADAFHAWFADGGRAPGDFGGLEHVEEQPDDVPEPTDDIPGLEEEIRAYEDEIEAMDVDLDDLDVELDPADGDGDAGDGAADDAADGDGAAGEAADRDDGLNVEDLDL